MTIFALCEFCGGQLDRDDSVCRLCGADNDPAANAGDSFDLEGIDFDRLKPWSKIKHSIIEDYLGAYTTILRRQPFIRGYVYIDAFAGAGVAVDDESDELVAAGALRALEVEPRFSEYHFIETNPRKADVLERLTRNRPEAHVHRKDFRTVLPTLLSRCRYEDYARALCVLDPYGLSVDYSLLQSIAVMRSVEIFFNFMLVGANRNVLWNVDPAKIPPARAALMTRVWGNEEWRNELYDREPNLFGETTTKVSNDRVVAAYRKRLLAAGFKFVPEPIAMKNRMNAPLYFLFFCSHNEVASRIAADVMNRHRDG